MALSQTSSGFKEWIVDACDDSQIERLLTATLELFSTKGYLETSVDDIVAMAHASKRTFYKHFPSKYDALHRCFQLVSSKLHLDIDRILSDNRLNIKQRIHDAISCYVNQLCVEHTPIAKLLLIEIVGISPELEKERMEYHRVFSETIQKRIAEIRDTGATINVDPQLISYVTVGAVNEVVTRIIQGQTTMDLSSVVESLTELLIKVMMG